jgi:ubiquinone/menaquinone biosynthesis C-methylase UbiE
MGDAPDPVKEAIIRKYDEEAWERNTPAWIEKGGTERVPEPPAAHYFIDKKVNQALHMCGGAAREDASVLEVGCSFGHMTSLLAHRFRNVTAVDISPASIDVAEKRLARYGVRNVRFVVDDAESLSKLADNSFDLVLSFSTVRFCPHPERAAQSIYRILKPGGTAVIDFPNRHSPWHFLIKRAAGIDRHIHDTLYSVPEAVELFRGAGFEVGEVKRFLFTTKRLPSGALPVFKTVEYALERIPFASRLAGIIMIRGRKP